jgi:hypothetical protein
MGCFTLGFLKELLITIIIVSAVIGVVRLLLVPYVLAPMGQAGSTIIQIVNIIVWAVIACFIVYILFDLLTCAFGGYGTGRLR